MSKKKLFFLSFFLIAIVVGCQDDEVVSKKKEPDIILEDHSNSSEKIKTRDRGASARVNITGGHLTFIVDSPVDASGNVLVNSSGTTQVNFRVIVTRNSVSDNVHLQFQVRNSRQTTFWTSSVIRTLDFPNNQLVKTISGSLNITSGAVNFGLCLFVRDFIVSQDSTGDCKNTIIGKPDLIITNKSVSNSTVTRGQSVTVSATVKNQGTDIYGTFVGYYLSTNTSFGGDTYIGDSEVTTLRFGESITKTEEVWIPSTATPGTYYIIFFVDYQYQVNESNESNNFVYLPITVL